DKLPSVWSINCSTGEFDDETKKDGGNKSICFTEAWERHTNGGAVGLLGSTRVSYSGRNDRMFWGWMDSHWPTFEPEWPLDGENDPEWRMGIVLEYGKLYMNHHYASDPYRMIAIEEFHWFGDPTMQMYAGDPLEFSVSHLPIIPAGSISFEVDAGVAGALVSLTQNGVIIGKAYTGSDGVALVEFDEALTNVENVHLVITRHQYRPYEDDLLVGATADGIIGLDKTAYRDGNTANLSLSDADLAGNGAQNLLIYSDTEPAGETVACTEFEDMGAFFGSILLTANAPVEGNGQLSISDGDTITLYYYDADNGTGNPEEKTDTASADTAPPDFAGLATILGGDTKVTLGWTAATDLTPPITYQIYRAETSGGQSFNAPTAVINGTEYVDTGLPNFVRYYYVVRATDVFGHQDDNTIELSDWTVGPMVIWEEDFDDNESGIPDTWEIIDGGTAGYTWNSENPGARSNSNWNGVFAIADSDYTGSSVVWNDALITEPIDCEGYYDIRLVFSHYYNYYSGADDNAFVHISNDGGTTWNEVVHWTGGDRSGVEDLDISAWADEQADVRLRFTYTGQYDYYWGIDNLQLIGIGAPVADFTADITTGEVPLEVTFDLETQGIVTEYLWEFGDGATSTVENPTHTYDEGGSFSVAV
ncbi:MAG TPA: C25 family cysteine peptidase, partial [bacterium]|nr:C25 family cysteine peptidase [bacterium]